MGGGNNRQLSKEICSLLITPIFKLSKTSSECLYKHPFLSANGDN
jgi:hypothetical protein